MSEQIHYDENLFFFNVMLRNLTQGLSLKIDAVFYLDKFVEEVFFLDSLLKKMATRLDNHHGLLRRDRILRQLIRSKRQFCDFLGLVMQGDTALTAAMEPYFPKFASIKDFHERNISEVKREILTDRHDSDTKQIVSSEEISYLLGDDPSP